jgi:hypothetical protein
MKNGETSSARVERNKKKRRKRGEIQRQEMERFLEKKGKK